MIQTKAKVDYNRSYVNRKTTARRETQNDRLLVFSFIIFVLIIGLILFAYIGQSLQIKRLNYTLNEKKLALEKI